MTISETCDVLDDVETGPRCPRATLSSTSCATRETSASDDEALTAANDADVGLVSHLCTRDLDRRCGSASASRPAWSASIVA